ncbi:MAG: 4-hydroxybenzoate octaprenyltransferase [Gammaproteobacteria bacterium]|nr:4-hydroxybenzoate octaprenyltransferase [Gammaproteobacteria bacterium]
MPPAIGIFLRVAGARAQDSWPRLRERLRVYAALTRIDRPIGAMLLLWPTLWALWIAGDGAPSLHLLLVFLSGVILLRSAGCALNDLADRGFDAHVQRTRLRPLATGAVQPQEALTVAGTLLALAFALVLTTNRLTILLSFVALTLAGTYPYMKRHTYLPQFVLGLAFSWGIPMAFAAQAGAIPQVAWLLFIANLLWTVVFDTIYAMVDREDDLRIGIKSTAILFEDADRVIIGVIQTMFIVVLAIVGRRLELGTPYAVSLAVAAAFMVYHQYLIRERLPQKCLQAFHHNNWIGLVIFAGLVATYGLRS